MYSYCGHRCTFRPALTYGSSPRCLTRQRFSTQAQRRSTARSQIESPCRRASYSRAVKNTTLRLCMRPSIMPTLELCRVSCGEPSTLALPRRHVGIIVRFSGKRQPIVELKGERLGCDERLQPSESLRSTRRAATSAWAFLVGGVARDSSGFRPSGGAASQSIYRQGHWQESNCRRRWGAADATLAKPNAGELHAWNRGDC